MNFFTKLPAVIGVSAAGLACGFLPWSQAALAQSPAPIEIRSQSMAVTLDRDFPRVLSYRTAGAAACQAPILQSARRSN